MTIPGILQTIGTFTDLDAQFFQQHTKIKMLQKNEVLLSEGQVCTNFYYVLSGAFFQFQTGEKDDLIIDLHLQKEWMFNQQSLTEQKPSNTSIKAFSKAEVVELGLQNFHSLCAISPSFLQFGKILNQSKYRTYLFDHALTPTEKYNYINQVKPAMVQVFPVKMIASYLKIAPETLSRVRAGF